jgi:hypothetical protein
MHGDQGLVNRLRLVQVLRLGWIHGGCVRNIGEQAHGEPAMNIIKLWRPIRAWTILGSPVAGMAARMDICSGAQELVR